MEFSRCFLRGLRSSRLSWFSCWPWSSQSACWAWLPGWPCILSSSWAFFIHVPWIYGAKHSSLSKNQKIQKILPRLNFWTRFQFFGRHDLFSVFFLNRIPKISHAHNFLAWISFRFSKKSCVKNYDSVFCLFLFLRRCYNFSRNLRRSFIFSQVLITAHRLIHFNIDVSNHKNPDLNFSKSSGNSARPL